MRGIRDLVVVISGGLGDIGSATTRRLADEGAHVYVASRRSKAEGDAAARELGARGYYAANQSDRPALDAMFDDVFQRHGRIDVAIANAGIVSRAMFWDIRVEDWEDVIGVNLTGCFHVGQAAARKMMTQDPLSSGLRGKILFDSSWCGRYPLPGGAPYVVAKAGVDGLTRVMAQELAHLGIRVNGVAPGLMEAGLTRMLIEKTTGLREKLLEMVPLDYLGTADEVASTFAFLCSSESDYITGQTLFVDGGASVIKRELPLPDKK